MKKILLTLLLLASASNIHAQNYDFSVVCSSGQTLYYKITSDTTVEVISPNQYTPCGSWPCNSAWSGYDWPEGNLIIPDSVVQLGNTYAVTSIARHAFHADMYGLTAVTIPSSIVTIGDSAFCGTYLHNITFVPGNLQIIGTYACPIRFATTIILPCGITSIGARAFTGNHVMWVPSSVVSIGSNAFLYNDVVYYSGAATGSPWGADSVAENLDSYNLTVYSNSDVMGSTTVVQQPTCDNVAIIQATANSGYHFQEWSDGNTENPRTIILSQDSSLIATFALNIGQITVVTSDSLRGSVSGSGMYNYNESVQITATANYGYHFTHWNDGNTQNPRTITVSQDSSFIAHFAPNTYSIVGLSSSTTMGSVSGSGTYNYLQEMTLTANPVAGYHFVRWNDQNTGNPRTISVTRDSVFIAYFVSDTHTVTVITGDDVMGSAYLNDSIAPTSLTVIYGTAISIDATPNYGYHFTSWSDGDTTAHRNFIVTSDSVLTALFAPNQYSVTLNGDTTMGSIYPNSGYYNYLTTLTISATPATGHYFLQWSSGVLDNPYTFTVTQDTSLTAIFVPYQYTLSLETSNNMYGDIAGGGVYDYNSQVVISANAAPHCHFIQWNDGNSSNPRLVTITSDTSFTAIFEPNPQYTITVTVNDPSRGSADGGGIFYAGDYAALTATPNEHYYFSSWSDGVNANPYYLTVIENAGYTAIFEPINYTVNLICNDDYMGSVYGGGSYPYGSTAEIEAQPFDGFRFIEWSDGNTHAIRSLLVEGNVSLQARFGDAHTEGIDDVENMLEYIYVQDGHIIVKGVENDRVHIYDLTGRKHSHSEQLPAGVYMVRIDNMVTKKVVVL